MNSNTNTRPCTQIRFFVYEDGGFLPLSSLSGPELASIDECVNNIGSNILANTQNKNIRLFSDTLCVVATEDDATDSEDDPDHGLLKCVLYVEDTPTPFPGEIISRINGNTFIVYPRQLGITPWGGIVEIRFDSI